MGIDHIPVVVSPIDLHNPAGFLTRELLDREMSDLDRASREYDSIPTALLYRRALPEEVIHRLENRGKIPVINLQGEHVANWDAGDLYRAIGAMKEREIRNSVGDLNVAASEEERSADEGDRRKERVASEHLAKKEQGRGTSTTTHGGKTNELRVASFGLRCSIGEEFK